MMVIKDANGRPHKYDYVRSLVRHPHPTEGLETLDVTDDTGRVHKLIVRRQDAQRLQDAHPYRFAPVRHRPWCVCPRCLQHKADRYHSTNNRNGRTSR